MSQLDWLREAAKRDQPQEEIEVNCPEDPKAMRTAKRNVSTFHCIPGVKKPKSHYLKSLTLLTNGIHS